MSAQFGMCRFDGKPVDPAELDRVRPMLAPYGPDAERSLCRDRVGVIYRAFHTTKEARIETQPHVMPSGAVLTWDGRLDNREDLARELRGELSNAPTDLSMVVAAYEHWGTGGLEKLVGDWALSIWEPRSQSLILAKDFVGSRHLYYSAAKDQVTWCTIIEPLVFLADYPLSLEEEYVAGWLAFLPATHLTPYVGIQSVPPSSFVLLGPGRHTVRKYWDFDPGKRIRYRSDREYEEHFRSAFAIAVKRRLRSDRPILAELSGGMDSSSIVCMADDIIARAAGEMPRLDTISYYDNSEPNWNERPYFTKVEERRGRTGCHVDVGSCQSFRFENHGIAATPGSSGRATEAAEESASYMASQGNRAVLSGIGGDEVLGGVPTPLPELEDLLAKAQFKLLAHQLKRWALNKRKPWFYLLWEAIQEFLPPGLVGVANYKRPAPWLQASFVKRHRGALSGYESRLTLLGPIPSFQENVFTLDTLRRQLGCFALKSDPPYERRYPYLDRDLLEFIFALPREQLVRPGQRRSLMRRALVGVVPDEILERKRKAYVARAPLATISTEWPDLVQISQNMICSTLGIVDSARFSDALRKGRNGQQVATVTLLRTLALEYWLRSLSKLRTLADVAGNTTGLQMLSTSTVISAEKN